MRHTILFLTFSLRLMRRLIQYVLHFVTFSAFRLWKTFIACYVELPNVPNVNEHSPCNQILMQTATCTCNAWKEMSQVLLHARPGIWLIIKKNNKRGAEHLTWQFSCHNSENLTLFYSWKWTYLYCEFFQNSDPLCKVSVNEQHLCNFRSGAVIDASSYSS